MDGAPVPAEAVGDDHDGWDRWREPAALLDAAGESGATAPVPSGELLRYLDAEGLDEQPPRFVRTARLGRTVHWVWEPEDRSAWVLVERSDEGRSLVSYGVLFRDGDVPADLSVEQVLLAAYHGGL